MKTYTYTQASLNLSLLLTTMCFYINTSQTDAAVSANLTEQNTYVVITRYKTDASAKGRIANALGNYVKEALANESNVMAEVFQEQDQPFVIWLLERWSNQEKFEDFSKSAQIRPLLLSITGDLQPINRYYLKDLAPLSKRDWRKAPEKDDMPIVIMLFVDAKEGTEDNFAKLYDIAMPKIRSEPGVITYGLSQFQNDRTQFVTYEKFRNEDAFKYHLNFPPIQPILDYLNTSIKKQPFQSGLHRLTRLQ